MCTKLNIVNNKYIYRLPNSSYGNEENSMNSADLGVDNEVVLADVIECGSKCMLDIYLAVQI